MSYFASLPIDPVDEFAFEVHGKKRCLVPLDADGQRLDLVLSRLAAATRSQIKVLINEKRVWVNGELAKAGRVIKLGEVIEFLPLPETPTTAKPQNIPLEVLFEDEYLMAINKPPGMVVHPAPGQWEGTVVNALLFRWGAIDHRDPLRPGIVHRLDKDTSGVLLIAKNVLTLERLSLAFKERRVQKIYLAVVSGRLRSVSGTIDFAIGRHPTDRKKMAVRQRGREAITHYQMIGERQGLSLIRLLPKTGRTHQLRVHLAAIGHPIIGDKMYGRQNLGNVPLIAQNFARQALHAQEISFVHPVTGSPLCLHAPCPADLQQLLSIFHTPLLTEEVEHFQLTEKKGSTTIKT